MTALLWLAWAAVCGALARRLAGGVLISWVGKDGAPGTLVSRGIGAMVLAWGLSVPYWLGWAAPGWERTAAWVPGTAAALFFLGMASGFPRGGMIPRSWPHVAAISARHGGALALPAAVLVWWLGLAWVPLVAAAAMVGPWYWLAMLWQPSVPLMGWHKGDSPAWAEPWVGAGVGLGWAMAMLWGGMLSPA